MEYLKFIAQSKGFSELLYRLILILKRFGLTEQKLKNFISETDKILKPYDVRATIFITAKLVEKRPDLLSWFERLGWETAIHGYTHINYKKLGAAGQSAHIKRAKSVFSAKTGSEVGFRAPYLSWNEDTASALVLNDINWSSHRPVLWDCLNLADFKEKEVVHYHRALTGLYEPKAALKFLVVPFFKDDLLEIPVSLPDDELLIDRLRIRDPEKLFEIWNKILLKTHKRGELFTLLLHPERSEIYSKAIQQLIERSHSQKQMIWIAGLNEVSDWWKEKTRFEICVTKTSPNKFQINAICSPRATLLVRGLATGFSAQDQKTSNCFSPAKERNFTIESTVKPMIGLSLNASPQLQQFLKNEGLPFEIAIESEEYAYHVEEREDFEENQLHLLDKIEKIQSPLVKFSRWPNTYRSALSLTYDLDAVTVFDFITRASDFRLSPVNVLDKNQPPTRNIIQHKKKKKVWIDLENSPHVLFFYPIIQKLEKLNFEVLITSRDCSQVKELAKLFHLKHKQIGHHYGKHKILKVIGLISRSLQLMPTVMKEKPDFALSHGSRSQLLAAAIAKIPSAIAVDYEHSKGLVLIHPDWVIAPDIIPKEAVQHWSQQILRYPGIKEDVYVPNFSPDSTIKGHLGFTDEELMITVRPPAMDAHYYTEESGSLFEYVINFLGRTKNLRMILLPRNKDQEIFIRKRWPDLCDGSRLVIPKNVVDGLNLIWYSDFVISGGGTMNREAAALAVPVYSIFRGKLGAVDKYLSDSGRLVLIENQDDVCNKIKLIPRTKTYNPMNRSSEALDRIVDSISKIV